MPNSKGRRARARTLQGGMNVNGLLFARHIIHDPGGMVVKNAALVVLMWVAAAHA